jgi:hypothetical protein
MISPAWPLPSLCRQKWARRPGGSLDRGGRAGIAEEQRGRLVVGADEAARRLAVQHEDASVTAGLQHRRREVQAVRIARAAEADVERCTTVAEPEPLVQHAARRRQEVVGRLGDEDEPRYRIPVPLQAIEQVLGGLAAQVCRRHSFVDHAPLADARHGDHLANFLGIEPQRRIEVVDDPWRRAGGDASDPHALDGGTTHDVLCRLDRMTMRQSTMRAPPSTTSV